MSDISTATTSVGIQFFMLTINPKHKKWDCSPNSAPNDQHGKRAHVRTKEANISSRCSTPPAQPEFSNRVQPKMRSIETVLATTHSLSLLEPGPINLPSSPAKGATNPDNGVTMEALGSTGDHDRDSTMGISKDGNNHGVMGLTHTVTHGRALPTPVPSQQLGIASHA